MVRACASQSVDLGFISSSRGISKDFTKWYSQLSLLGAQHKKDKVENKWASLLFVSLDKTLDEMSPSLCGRQMMGPSSLLIPVAQSDEKHANIA